MKYIKFKEDTKIYNKKTNKTWQFIKDELVTTKEFNKYTGMKFYPDIPLNIEIVDINKNKTIMMFGVRREIKDE